MKSIFFVLITILTLISCEKYQEPTLLSLSGEYRFDKITYEQIDNTNSSNSMVYYPGDLYVNPNETFPMDSIAVGFERMHMDYSVIRFDPINNADGSVTWTKEYTYNVYGQYSSNDLGYIQFNCNGSTRTWKIIEDGVESLVLRTSGQWANGSSGSDVSITMFLTRVGP